MFNRKKDKLDEPIDKVLEELRQQDPNSQEFATNLAYLERLNTMKNENRRDSRPSANAILDNVGLLLQIGVLAAFEQKHVFTSKALGYIKPQRHK